MNDKIIACYVCIVIVIILVLIVVIIVLSMFDSQKYRIFWPLKICICIGIACLQINWSIGLSWVNSACSNLLWLQRHLTWHFVYFIEIAHIALLITNCYCTIQLTNHLVNLLPSHICSTVKTFLTKLLEHLKWLWHLKIL